MGQKVLLIAVLGLLGWGQDTVQPPASNANVEGTVRDAQGQPVAGVMVTLVTLRCGPLPVPPQPIPPPPPPPPRYEVVSDAVGRFSFPNVAPAECNLIEVQHPGYPTAVYPEQPVSTFVTVPGFRLTAGQKLTGVTISLVRSILSGRVTNERGEPIAGVTVRAVQQADLAGRILFALTGGGQTDSNGEFKLADLDQGAYYLGFSVPGKSSSAVSNEPESAYVDSYYPGVRSMAEAEVVNVGHGKDRPRLDMQLTSVPVFHVRGKVTGLPANVDLAANEVRLFLVPPDGDLYSAQNNPGRKVAADGTFDYGGLPAGDWTLMLIAHQMVLYQRTMRITDRNVDNLVINSLKPIELQGSIKIVPELPPNAVPEQKPLGMPDSVRLVPRDNIGRPTGGRVFSDGTFSVLGVAASIYDIEVETPSDSYVTSATLGGREVLTTGIDLTQGASKGPLQIVVSLLTGRVSGTVKNEAGQPVASARVLAVPTTVRASGASANPEVAADEKGHFQLKLAPGTYRIYAWESVRALAVNYSSTAAFLKMFETFSVSVTVAENDRKQITLTRIPDARVQEALRR